MDKKLTMSQDAFFSQKDLQHPGLHDAEHCQGGDSYPLFVTNETHLEFSSATEYNRDVDIHTESIRGHGYD